MRTTRPCSKACELYFSQAIIWVKEHPVLTRKDFMGNHEWCFYGWREGLRTSSLARRMRLTWERQEGEPTIDGPSDGEAGRVGRPGDEVLVGAGENVLDLFGGSGSTLIAAEQTGRHAYLMESTPYLRRHRRALGRISRAAKPSDSTPKR